MEQKPQQAWFGCAGDRREVEARKTGKGGKSWTSLDRKAAAEGDSIAFIGRLWMCVKHNCPTPETAIA